MEIREDYLEKVYAGWLGKIIGIRLGAPTESMTYETIQNLFGAPEEYVVDYQRFAADDDSNGPLFFIRALEDSGKWEKITPQDVAEALLNYVPCEHGFFWWGGYGVSTEHTAYLNLRRGIQAPASGSAETNGLAVAEQIGGQIFSDTWGLVCPGDPEKAARLAAAASSVTHDGNAVYGGSFVAACVSLAFVETDIHRVLDQALALLPPDSEYVRVANDVSAFYREHPEDWRACFSYIRQNYGYDKYPGVCHVIPNSAVMILAMRYGGGDFSKTITICNLCGWDTDCNVGNTGAILGTLVGLPGIDAQKWRKPINDFLACSSVLGCLNLTDLPYGASYLARQAYHMAGQEAPGVMKEILERRIDSCHFEYPGSTHAMEIRVEADPRYPGRGETRMMNTEESAHTGKRSLKLFAKSTHGGQAVSVFKRTYLHQWDFDDSRYNHCFSPMLYPGQTVHGSAYVPDYAPACGVCLYVKCRDGAVLCGEMEALKQGKWKELSYQIPALDDGLIEEAGFRFMLQGGQDEKLDFCAMVDDLYFDGEPSYTIDFSKERMEYWRPNHWEITQFSRWKGEMELCAEGLRLWDQEETELYTGHINWQGVTASCTVKPDSCDGAFLLFRVQGAMRCYAFGLCKEGAVLLKNSLGYKELSRTAFSWEYGKLYRLTACVKGSGMECFVDGVPVLQYQDIDRPYEHGAIGLRVQAGSGDFSEIRVNL